MTFFNVSRVADYGEDRLVAALLAQLPSGMGRGVIAGAGDDCAIVRPAVAKRWQLLKTDCMIEGVHFAPGIPPESVGWKALCRPLSDIAAMGGKPAYALVTLALPGEAAVEFATGVYAGIGRAAREFGVEVVGGETARTPGPCWVSVVLTGSVRRGRAVTRGGGRPGDWLFVTGWLGGSFAGGRHLHFRPRLSEARWLASHFPVRAMMDLSDGLAADLPRMAAASGTGYAIDADRLPRTEGCSVTQALGDGEDYELLFALGPKHAAKLERFWKTRWPDVPLTAIGTLADQGIANGLDGASGYDHFNGGK